MRFEKFCEISEMYRGYKHQCIKDFRPIIPYIEEAIRFQYYLNEKMFNVLEKERSLVKKSNVNKIEISQSLFSKNNQLLYMMYQSSVHGMVVAANILGRTIYESILIQYYVGLYDDNMEEYLKKSDPYKIDKIKSKKYKDIVKYLKKIEPYKIDEDKIKCKKYDDIIKYLKKIDLDKVEENKIIYNHNYFKQKLYKEDRLKIINSQYKIFSGYTHTNPYTLVDEIYDKNRIKDTLELSYTLIVFNILSYLQLYTYVPNNLKLAKKITKPFIDMLIRVKSTPHTLFPNKDGIKELICKESYIIE